MWKIRNFPGGKEFLLRAKFGLPSVAAEDEQTGRMPPIRVTYEIPYFTVSGIQVRACLDLCCLHGPSTCWSVSLFGQRCALTFDLVPTGPLPQGHRKERLPGERKSSNCTHSTSDQWDSDPCRC